MSVYVDAMGPCLTNRNWRWRENCHLFADTEAELVMFGLRIGLLASWLQKKPRSLVHFDLTRGMRARAVRLGAVEVDRDVTVAHIRRARGDAVRLEP
jgi:hypothetical protein